MENSSASTAPQSSRNALTPVVLLLGVASIICSFAINNYWGMGLAFLALVIAQIALKNVSQLVWILCISFSAIGFSLGLCALLMRLFVDSMR